MSITIELYTGHNPFEEYPQLRDIWPEPFKSIAEEAVIEHLGLIGQCEVGDIFIVRMDEQVIGVSGYFPYDEAISDLGLRWHGIIPAERGNGYSGMVLEMVAKCALERFPRAGSMIELVPLTDYGKPLGKYFGKVGFEPFGQPETYEWSENAWQPYRIPLARLAGQKLNV
jgi:hypothetical protein